jgi:hypothetical protein
MERAGKTIEIDEDGLELSGRREKFVECVQKIRLPPVTRRDV